MIILIFIMITVVQSFDILPLHCVIQKEDFGNIRLCDVKYSKHYYFHDFTGENQIMVLGDKKLRNHGKVIGHIRHNKLYISELELSDKQWEKVFKN